MKMQPPRALLFGLSMAALALAMTTSQAQEASAGPQTEPAQAYDHSATQTITFRDSATPGATLHVAPEQGPPEQAPPSPALVAPPEPPLPAGLGAQTPAPLRRRQGPQPGAMSVQNDGRGHVLIQ